MDSQIQPNAEITFITKNETDEQEEIPPIPQEDESIKVADEDASKLKIEAVVAIIPLEPCVACVSCFDPNSPASENGPNPYKGTGIPGFYDPIHRKFFLLNGKPMGKAFDDKFNEYLERQERSARLRQSGETGQTD